MNLNMIINNVKCINLLEFSFPLEPGIYAITGENGSGKSTFTELLRPLFDYINADEIKKNLNIKRV